MGVYYRGRKIGYTHATVEPSAGGHAFTQASLLRLTIMATPQVVRTSARGATGPDFALRDVEFQLSSGAGTLEVRAAVAGASLQLKVRAGADVTERTVALTEPIYLPSFVRVTARGGELVPGRRLEATAVDVSVTNLPGNCTDTLAGGVVYTAGAFRRRARVRRARGVVAHVDAAVDVDAIDLRRHEVAALHRHRLRHAEDGEVVGLGPSGGEDHVARLGPEEVRHLRPRRLDRLLRVPAEGVVAALRVPEAGPEPRDHRLEDAGIHGRRREMVEVDGAVHGHGVQVGAEHDRGAGRDHRGGHQDPGA